MPERNKFSHLPLPLVLAGKPKLFGGGKPDTRTFENRENRINHGGYIKRQASQLSRFWKEKQEERLREHLPEIKTGIPILLEIDPKSDISFLKGLGFEVISELENGYVIVSNGDTDFAVLNRKTEDFIIEISRNCNTPARVYAFHEDEARLQKIFGKKLIEIWETVEEERKYEVDVNISCSGNIFSLEQPPEKEVGVDEEEYKSSLKYKNWQKKYSQAYELWDDLKFEREQQFGSFIEHYDGEFIGAFIDGPLC